VLEKLLKEERSKNLSQVAELVSNDKFNYLNNDLREHRTEVKKLIENIESTSRYTIPNFRNDIQEYFNSLNLQDLLLKE